MNFDGFASPAEDPLPEADCPVSAEVLEPCPVSSWPEPVVTMREDHTISRRDIDEDALKVLYRLVRNDFTAYLVGGGVRDLLLGRKPKDFDISTNAKPEEIRALFRNCILIGRRFRLAHIRYGEKIIETSTFRRTPECIVDPADPDADLFQRDDNQFGTPQEDALRRDFTVNGLFYDIESFSIIDYVGGMEDLAAKRIRCIGDPCIRFREDPVRMVRAIRFASRLDFSLDEETRDAIVRHADELSKASPARLLEEITRLFAFSSGEKAVRLLQETGLLKVILPEVSDALANEHVDAGQFWRRLRALDKGDTVMPDASPSLIFSVLLLDALKLKLERDWPPEDFPRLRFDKVHSFLEPLAQRLRFPRKMVDRIVHIYLGQHRFSHPGGKRGSIANFVTQDSFHEALAFAEIVHSAAGKPTSDLNHWRDMLAERIYGREEGRGERLVRLEQKAVSNGSGQENIRLDEPKQGTRLSRSARRRRNKKLRRLRHNGEPQEITANESGDQPAVASSGEKETAPVQQVEKSAPAPEVAVLPPPPAAAETQPEVKEEEKKKPARSRNRRPRKKDADKPQAETVEEKPAPQPEPAAPDEPFQPLRAAAFYNPPPEEEKKKKRAPRAKSAGKKTKAKAEKSAKEETPAPQGPLPMDKADEADQPINWLDEI